MSQQELKKYLEFAQDKYEQGDYVYALQYYQKAMAIDSNTINTLWEYAETLKAYKDYPKAAYYYQKVYDRESGKLYPPSLLNYGLMVKQTGDYDKALEIFKRAAKHYRKTDRQGYLYKKSRQEIESCVWAKSNQGDFSKLIFEHLPENINTPDAEFGHRIYENQLMFSSLKADSLGGEEEVYDPSYKTHLYSSKIEENGFGEVEQLEGLNWEDASTGNGSFSLDGKRFYFSHCGDDGVNYRCKIVVAYVENGRFVDVDTLGNIINEEGSNSTMPFIGEWEGDEVLFFASDRAGGRGKMDIWYSFIQHGNQYRRPRNVRGINTMDNELSPYWDSETQTLYFSSSWHNGFGGQDVFKSAYKGQFQPPENLMEPINSPANDLYYFQTSTGDTAFFSSNRLGSNYSKNPTCCSDIYMVRKELLPTPPTIAESLEDLNLRLPVTLYFHNDIPNPRSTATTTNVNYMDSYFDYTAMKDTYKKEYALGLQNEDAEDAREDIEDFFLEYVEQGVKDLALFRDVLLEELQRGRKIEMIVKGFASPLAKTDYNVNLTKRRIGSLKNYLSAYKGGVFQPYLDQTAGNGATLTIKEIPFGEYSADQFVSDNPNDKKNSVYSRAAASERKIEIQSVDILREEDTLSTLLTADQLIYDAGEQIEGAIVKHEFLLKNVGDYSIEIDEINSKTVGVNFEFNKKELQPGEIAKFNMSFDTKNKTGHQVGEFEILYNGLKKGLTLTIVMEVK